MTFSKFWDQKLPDKNLFWFLSLLFLLFFPLFLLVSWLEMSLWWEVEEIRGRKAKILHQSLFELRGKRNCQNFLDFIAKKASMQEDPAQFVFLEAQKLKNRFPGVFEIVIFDKNSHLISEYSDLKKYHPLFSRFGKLVPGAIAGNLEEMNEFFSQLRPILGSCLSNFPTLWNRGIYRSSILPERSFAYISTNPSGPRFLALVSLPESESVFLGSLQVIQKEEQFKGSCHAILDLSKDLEEQKLAFGSAAADLEPALLKLGDRMTNIIYSKGYMWGQTVLEKNRPFIICFKDTSLPAFKKDVAQIQTWAGMILACGFVLVILFHSVKKINLSLSTRISALFLYATTLPILLLWFSSQGLLKERFQTMENEIQQQHEGIMRQLEDDYLNFLSIVEGTLQRASNTKIPSGFLGVQKAIAITESITRRLHPTAALVFDRQGEIRHEVFHPILELVFKSTMKLMISRLIRDMAELSGEKPAKANHVKEEVLRGFFESFDVDVNHIAGLWRSSLNRMFPLTLLKLWKGEFALCFFQDEMGKNRMGSLFLWTRFLTMQRWLLSYKRKLEREWPGKYFFFSGLGIDPKDPATQKALSSFPFIKEARNYGEILDFQPIPSHQIVSRKAHSFYLSGVKIRLEDETNFFIACSDETAKSALIKVKRQIIGIGLVLFVLGFVISIQIIQHFLAPLQNLEKGLHALKERRFEHRVPVSSGDELGKLARNFNNLLEGMADLEIAKIVQDTFFPKEPLRSANWEIFGASVSASRVGGDYFDYFPLPDGRWLLLVGDVSGHGVSAALVVGIAKAIVVAPRDDYRPSVILQELNVSIKNILSRKKLMSCWIGVFDPNIGELTTSNAGHPYPLLVRNRKIEELIVRHPLLGTSPKEFEEKRFFLQRGDFLCLYTDGLPEATSRKNQQLGYEPFYAALPGLAGENAVETEANVRAWHRGVTMYPDTLEDDITLVILQSSIKMETAILPRSLGLVIK